MVAVGEAVELEEKLKGVVALEDTRDFRKNDVELGDAAVQT